MGTNGTARLALAKMQLKKEAGGAQEMEQRALVDNKKKGKQEKISLKNPSEHNHSN